MQTWRQAVPVLTESVNTAKIWVVSAPVSAERDFLTQKAGVCAQLTDGSLQGTTARPWPHGVTPEPAGSQPSPGLSHF